MWEHSLPSRDKSSDAAWEPPSEDQVGVPWLVGQLAGLQLRSLQEGASLASLASEAAAEAEELPEAVVVVDGKPSRIPTSELPSPSPMPSARRLPRTSSSSEYGQVRNPNGTFGALEESKE